jgi:DNA-binding transcriptional ArsR family regulator
MQAGVAVGAKIKRLGQLGKSIDQRIGFALAHRVRVEILRLLNERVYTADEIAAILGVSRQTAHHHLTELLSGGLIEIARVERRRNAHLYFYRAVEMPEFSEEALRAMTSEERQAIVGLTVQHTCAEIMAALATGRVTDDAKVCLVWCWFNLDRQGRGDLSTDQHRQWERAYEIEAESINRIAISGEKPKTYVVALWGFERARSAPTPRPETADKRVNIERLARMSDTIDQRIGFAVAHPLRVEIITLLIEGVYTADQIAAVVGESRQTVHHHLKELLNCGLIEIVKTEKRRNAHLYFFRTVAMPEFSEADLLTMTREERLVAAGLVVHHANAEVIAALAAGKLKDDFQVCLAWRWFSLDHQGRSDLAADQLRHWERAYEFEAESSDRIESSGEEPKSYVVAMWGFERARTAPVSSVRES